MELSIRSHAQLKTHSFSQLYGCCSLALTSTHSVAHSGVPTWKASKEQERQEANNNVVPDTGAGDSQLLKGLEVEELGRVELHKCAREHSLQKDAAALNVHVMQSSSNAMPSLMDQRADKANHKEHKRVLCWDVDARDHGAHLKLPRGPRRVCRGRGRGKGTGTVSHHELLVLLCLCVAAELGRKGRLLRKGEAGQHIPHHDSDVIGDEDWPQHVKDADDKDKDELMAFVVE